MSLHSLDSSIKRACEQIDALGHIIRGEALETVWQLKMENERLEEENKRLEEENKRLAPPAAPDAAPDAAPAAAPVAGRPTKITFDAVIAPKLVTGETVSVEYAVLDESGKYANKSFGSAWNGVSLECLTTGKAYVAASGWSRGIHAYLTRNGLCRLKGAKETHANFYVIRNGTKVSLASLAM